MRSVRNGSIASAVSAILMLGGGPSAPAQTGSTISFDIRTQPLEQALKQFAERTGLQLIFPAEEIDPSVIATELVGNSTPQEGLERLLAGTSYSYEFVNARTVTIRSNKVGGGPRSGDIRLAQSADAPAAGSSRSDGDGLEEVVVRGLNFKYDTAESVNKMPLSIKDTPQSVKVITEDMLQFSGITKFEDVYKLDASSLTSHNKDQYVRTYFRGFKVDSNDAIKVDGFRMSGYPTLDLAPFERFEVVKGATSSIYGQAPIGGTLNAISKMPTTAFGGSLSLEGGSFSHYRGQLDVHGALAGSDKLSGRLVAAYVDEDSFMDYAFNKRLVIAPSVRYEFTPTTTVTLMGQYQDAKFLPLYGIGIQYLGGNAADPDNYTIPDVPRSRLPASPLSRSERETTFTRLLLEHEFQSGWKLRAAAQNVDVDVLILGAGTTAISPIGDIEPMYLYMRDATDEYYSGELNLFGNVEAFGREHTLFFGADYTSDKSGGLGGFGYAISGFNIFNPDYSIFPKPPASIGGYPGQYSVQRNIEEFGFTSQAVLKATDQWSFILEGRYSHVKKFANFECCDETAPNFGRKNFLPGETYTNTAWTFLAGSTYAITPAMNVYASYGQTFTPRLAYEYVSDDSPGRPVGPEEGEAYEIGLKGDVLAGRSLLWSVAAFDIARTRVADTDYEHPGMGFVVLRGKQQSRGIEVELQGELAPGWDAYLSTAVMKNEFVNGPYDGFTSLVGPKFGLSLFSSYELQGGSLKGLGFGGGVVHKRRGEVRMFEDYQPAYGQRFNHLLDDYTEVDLRTFYNRGPWRYQLSVTNLLNDKYYSAEDNTLFYALSINPARQILANVTYRFGARR